MGELVIRGARLLDGLGSAPVEGATLVAEGGTIRFAGPGPAAPPPSAGAVVLDAGGRTLLPGLIDCHVHLCLDGVADFVREATELNLASAALKAARNARLALEAGITAVRDLGGHKRAVIEVARAQRAGTVEGPRILTAAEVLTITGGHAHFIGREVDTADELVKAVRELVKEGADVIKLMATGGVLTPGIGALRPAFTTEQIAAAVREAHEAGRRVAAHAIGAEGIVAALRAGVDSAEHGCYLTDEALGLLVSSGARLVATLVAPERIAGGGEGIPDYAVRKAREVAGAHRESFRRATEAGARIAAGTDAGTPFNPHGGLWRELALMHDAGMPLDRVLRAVTSEAADLLGLADAGALESGRAADAVLLDGDPLADAGAYGRVALVVQAGRVIVDRRGP
ncbi:MAG: amidohydrolase family protein [Acidobacteria bacterium]|nr:amidohydrolase family protein [Acidobacteriota bacterium]